MHASTVSKCTGYVAMQDAEHVSSGDQRPGSITPLPGRPVGTARAEQIQLSPGNTLRPPPVSLELPFEWPNMLELLTATPGKVTLFTMRFAGISKVPAKCMQSTTQFYRALVTCDISWLERAHLPRHIQAN